MSALCHSVATTATPTKYRKMRHPHGLWQRAGWYLCQRYGSVSRAAATLEREYGMSRTASYRLVNGHAKSTDWLEQLLAREGVKMLEALFPELLEQRDEVAVRLYNTLVGVQCTDRVCSADVAEESLQLTRLAIRPDLDDLVRRSKRGWLRRLIDRFFRRDQ